MVGKSLNIQLPSSCHESFSSSAVQPLTQFIQPAVFLPQISHIRFNRQRSACDTLHQLIGRKFPAVAVDVVAQPRVIHVKCSACTLIGSPGTTDLAAELFEQPFKARGSEMRLVRQQDVPLFTFARRLSIVCPCHFRRKRDQDSGQAGEQQSLRCTTLHLACRSPDSRSRTAYTAPSWVAL